MRVFNISYTSARYRYFDRLVVAPTRNFFSERSVQKFSFTGLRIFVPINMFNNASVSSISSAYGRMFSIAPSRLNFELIWLESYLMQISELTKNNSKSGARLVKLVIEYYFFMFSCVPKNKQIERVFLQMKILEDSREVCYCY